MSVGALDDRVFTDAMPANCRASHSDREELAPLAAHSPDPSPVQALHYGVHKAVKVLDASHRGERGRVWFHWKNVEGVWARAVETGDRRLLLSAWGAERALAGRFGVDALDYGSPALAAALVELELVDDATLARRIRRMRWFNRRGLSPDWRRNELCEGVTRTYIGFARTSAARLVRSVFPKRRPRDGAGVAE